jgi:DNA-binding NarL/FixJ family response regulator
MEAYLPDHGNRESGYEAPPLQVLLVDEQDVFRRKIRDILHGMGGFEVVAETTSCRMALETIERLRIDLVMLELHLSDGDGLHLTARLKQSPASPHVIIFSPTMHDVTLTQVILAGADGYLIKDTPTRDIIRACKNFERGGPAMLPTMMTRVIHLLVERCNAAEIPQQVNLFQNGHAPFPASEAERTGVRDLLISNSNIASPLSPREEKVFALLRQGQSNKQIAGQLAISHYTVGKHVQNILRKLGVVNRTQAAHTSFEGGTKHQHSE